jgi:regulation of enolase protein 1 (concanavalin A-like superfamily)
MPDLSFLDTATWLNPPPRVARKEGALIVETGDTTDFWRETHYGFVHDTGHFLGRETRDDFAATVTWTAPYTANFDQAGLMIWREERYWIKAGIELTDGALHMSAVVTRDRSDWSTVAMAGTEGPHSLRLTRVGGAVIIDYLRAEGRWQFMRLADFPPGPLRLGVMACSPSRAGLTVRFTDFTVTPPPANPLHPETWDSVPGIAG